jgi:hypothetical protein
MKLTDANVCLKAYTGFADLSLDIKTNFSYYLEGDSIQFNITVSNKADPSGEINVSSLLDDSVTLLSHTVDRGIFDESNGVWIIDNLNAGESAKLVLTLKFNEKKASVINSFSLKSLSYSYSTFCLDYQADPGFLAAAKKSSIVLLRFPCFFLAGILLINSIILSLTPLTLRNQVTAAGS